jgi:proline iminopeptidase
MNGFARRFLAGGLASLASACAGHAAAQAPAELDVREGFVDAGADVELFYRTVGTGSDTLVVVHGGPGFNMDYFFDDLRPLAERLTLVFYDQRGTGQSSLVADSAELAASRFADDLEAVRSHFELESLNILGHSWGAGVAALYAMRHPDRVGRLVIVGGIPLQEALLMEGFDQMQASRDSAELRGMESLYEARLENPEDAELCRAYYVLWFGPFFGVPAAAGPQSRRLLLGKR